MSSRSTEVPGAQVPALYDTVGSGVMPVIMRSCEPDAAQGDGWARWAPGEAMDELQFYVEEGVGSFAQHFHFSAVKVLGPKPFGGIAGTGGDGAKVLTFVPAMEFTWSSPFETRTVPLHGRLPWAYRPESFSGPLPDPFPADFLLYAYIRAPEHGVAEFFEAALQDIYTRFNEATPGKPGHILRSCPSTAWDELITPGSLVPNQIIGGMVETPASPVSWIYPPPFYRIGAAWRVRDHFDGSIIASGAIAAGPSWELLGWPGGYEIMVGATHVTGTTWVVQISGDGSSWPPDDELRIGSYPP